MRQHETRTGHGSEHSTSARGAEPNPSISPHNWQPGPVIIDNATLRGALIALGIWNQKLPLDGSPIKVFDYHVACAEVLIESLLLHETVYVPAIHGRDYPRFTKLLQDRVGSEVLRDLILDPDHLNSLRTYAETEFTKWSVGDAELMQRLRQYAGAEASITSWDRWVHEKYNMINAYVAWVASDFQVLRLDTTDDVRLGSPNNSSSLTDAGKNFGRSMSAIERETVDASLLWLAFRVCLYDQLSWNAGIPYVPHPQRSALWTAVNLRRSSPRDFWSIPPDALRDARLQWGEQINREYGFEAVQVEIPPFFTYALAKARSASEVIDVVLEMREQRDVRRLRSMLADLASSTSEQDYPHNIREAREQIAHVRRSLLKDSPSTQLEAVGVPTVTIAKFAHNLSSSIEGFREPHIAFLRDVFRVTNGVWKLSHLYDKLFQYHRELAHQSISQPERLVEVLRGGRRFSDSDSWGHLFADAHADFMMPSQCREWLHDLLNERQEEPVRVILMDINRLDEINQLHGHAAGDDVLRNAALALAVFSPDVISQTGGDTFIAVFVRELGVSLDNIRAVVKRRAGVEISIGAAVYPADATNADDLFAAAFRRMLSSSRGRVDSVGGIQP